MCVLCARKHACWQVPYHGSGLKPQMPTYMQMPTSIFRESGPATEQQLSMLSGQQQASSRRHV
jgi:hypothetical protein